MPNAPTPPPPPDNWDSNTVSALAGSSLNTDGSFKSGGTDYWLFQVTGLNSGDCPLVWYGTTAEAQGYPRTPLDSSAHTLVSTGSYVGSGVWEDGNGDRFVLQRTEDNVLSPAPA
ncbi:MAG: hypothetical protein AAGH15_05135 [Myxococcota bacterium]